MYLKLCILGKRASTLPMAILTFVRNELMKFFCYFVSFFMFYFLLLKSGGGGGGGGGGGQPLSLNRSLSSPGLFTRQKRSWRATLQAWLRSHLKKCYGPGGVINVRKRLELNLLSFFFSKKMLHILRGKSIENSDVLLIRLLEG